MKYLFILSLSLLSTIVFAQNKKTYFLKEDLTQTSEKAFWKDKDAPGLLHLKYYADTADFYVKVTREHTGILSKDSLNLLKKDLEQSAGASIDPGNMIVIDFYPGKDACNSGGTTDRAVMKKYHDEYLKKLHSLAPISQFYIYGQKEGVERYDCIGTWNPDLNSRVKYNFFPLDYPCGSVVVIRPDGQFKSYFGEYSKDQVWDFVKQLKAK